MRLSGGGEGRFAGMRKEMAKMLVVEEHAEAFAEQQIAVALQDNASHER